MRELSHDARKASFHHDSLLHLATSLPWLLTPFSPGTPPGRPLLPLSPVSCPGPPLARPQQGWGVDGRVLRGQGPSLLITAIEPQRQKLKASDISFILVFCFFVPLCLCRPAAGASIITSCLLVLHSLDYRVTAYKKLLHFQPQRVPLCLLFKHEMNIISLSSSFPFRETRGEKKNLALYSETLLQVI